MKKTKQLSVRARSRMNVVLAATAALVGYVGTTAFAVWPNDNPAQKELELWANLKNKSLVSGGTGAFSQATAANVKGFLKSAIANPTTLNPLFTLDEQGIVDLVKYALQGSTGTLYQGNAVLYVQTAMKTDQARAKDTLPIIFDADTDEPEAADLVNQALLIDGKGAAAVNLSEMAKKGIVKTFAAVMGAQILQTYRDSLTPSRATDQANVVAAATNMVKNDKKATYDTVSRIADINAYGGTVSDIDNYLTDVVQGAVLANKGKVFQIASYFVKNATGVDTSRLAVIKAAANTATDGKKTVPVAMSTNATFAIAISGSNLEAYVYDTLNSMGAAGKPDKVTKEVVAGSTIADQDKANVAAREGVQAVYDAYEADKVGAGVKKAKSPSGKAVEAALDNADLVDRGVGPASITQTGTSVSAGNTVGYGGADDAAALVVTAVIDQLIKSSGTIGTVDAGKPKTGAAISIPTIVGAGVKTVLKLDADPYAAKSQILQGAAPGAAVGAVAQVAIPGMGTPSLTSNNVYEAMLASVIYNAVKKGKKDYIDIVEGVVTAAIEYATPANPVAFAAALATIAKSVGDNKVGKFEHALIDAAASRGAANAAANNPSWGAYGVADNSTPNTAYSLVTVTGTPVTDISGF